MIASLLLRVPVLLSRLLPRFGAAAALALGFIGMEVSALPEPATPSMATYGSTATASQSPGTGTRYQDRVKALNVAGTTYGSDSTLTAYDTPTFTDGDGTSGNPYKVSTAAQLYAVRDYLDSYFLQVNDITIDTVTYPSWTPIGTSIYPFVGSYDGGGRRISGLKINTATDTASDTILGLFGVIGSAATVKNVNLDSMDFDITQGGDSTSVESFIGGLAGVNRGTITNCRVSGTIDAASMNIKIGSLVGCNGDVGASDDGDISHCESSCALTVTVNYQTGHIGGLAGASFVSGSLLLNCTNSGTVTAVGGSSGANTGISAGGVIGYASDTTVTTCTSSGAVSATNGISQAHAGGLIGTIVGSCTVSGCSSSGSATAGDKSGSATSKISSGGLIGYSFSSSTVTNCHSSGAVTSSGSGLSSSSYTVVYAGGFMGYGSAGDSAVVITGCNATGDVSSTVSTYGYGYAGGFSGLCLKATMSKCYALGDAGATAVAGGAYAGGFIGDMQSYASSSPSSATNCYSTGEATANCITRERAGGFAGVNNTNSTISYCYGAGTPATVENILAALGGLVGLNLGTVSNSCYDTTVAGQSDTTKGTPLTTAVMKSSAFVTTLTNAGATWKLVSNLNDSYPILDGVGVGTLPTSTITYTDSANTSTTYGTDTVAQSVVFSFPSSISPTKVGYSLSGWYTDTSCAEPAKWNFTTGTVTADTPLYAGWELVDTAAPAAPTLTTASTTTTNRRPVLSGIAEAGSVVNIYSSGTTLIATVTAHATTGAWTFTPSSDGAYGTYALTATATDTAGNVSTASTVLTLTIEEPSSPPPSKDSQRITFAALGDKWSNATPFTVSASASSGLPVSFSIVSGPASLSGSTVTLTGAPGSVTIRASQSGNASYAPAPSVEQSFTVRLAIPVVTTPTQVPAPSPGGTATLNSGTGGVSGLAYQWQRNGEILAGATGATLMLTEMQPPAAGLYTYTASVAGGTAAVSEPVIVGLATEDKVTGAGELVGADIQHPNGNVYDQLLLEGAGATFTAEPAQITRMSYVDLSGDIVQVEFSGAGSLSLVMDDAGTPAPAANYNQPGVNYVRGHVGIVITGADETTNVSVFSVGRITAVNQTLFREGVAYDGVANVAFIAIQSTNGKFGGVRTGNVEYYAQSGFTGLYAPGVAFSGPVNIGDIQAFDSAQPLLVVGSANNVRIAGGSLAQPNGQPVTVNGLTQLTMAPGQTSQGAALPAQANQGVLEQDGVDVTDLLVAAP